MIEYFFESRLHRNGIFTWDVKNHMEIFVQEGPKSIPKTPSFIEPQSTPVYFWCSIYTGLMTIAANVESTNMSVSDVAKISYGVHNESTSRVKALEIYIDEYCSFHA